MAARRLVIVMLVLLGISSLAAVLAPEPRPDGATTEKSADTRPPKRSQPTGELVRRTIDARDRAPAIRIGAGDQLALTVRAREPDGVEISGLGVREDVDPDAPAHFDLLPPEGTYPIRLVEANRTIGRLVVRPTRTHQPR